MSLIGLLRKRSTIQRSTATGAQDSHGMPVVTWADLATSVPCRRRVNGGEETFADDDKTATPAREVIYFLNGQDITENDRIVLESVTYEVLRVNPIAARRKIHHKRCACVVVR